MTRTMHYCSKLSKRVKLQWQNWYNWSDFDVLEEQLRKHYRTSFVVAEVCAGPNVAVPYALANLAGSFIYVSVDILIHHILLQRSGVPSEKVNGVLGDAVYPPLAKNSVDLIIFHHAIDDIFETRGMAGVALAIENAFETLKKGTGCMIFTHSIMDFDPDTRKVDLTDVESILNKAFDCRQTRINSGQEWLVVDNIHRLSERSP